MSGIVPYRSALPLRGTRYLAGGRLGALGASAIVGTVATNAASLGAGTAAGSLIGTAAGTAGGALFGAAAGSVVPIIGTVIGAVVGILTSKLFGHANYGAVYANIANISRLVKAYTQVAGQYVGRNYGWPEIQYIWHGALVSGLFPGNGPPAGQACTEAMIAHNIKACGDGAWIDNLLGTNRPTNAYPGSIANLIQQGLNQGIVDPVTMTSRVLVPGMEALAAKKNNGWISVARSTNPAIYNQLLEDTADYMMSVVNPSMPAYYGTQNVQPLPASAPAVAAVAPPAVAVSIPGTAPASVPPVVAASLPSTAPVIVQSPPTAAPPPPITTPTGATIVPPGVISVSPTSPALAAAGGTTAPVDATAAYLQQLQSQGASQNQALLSAIQQLQSQGMSAQAAQSTVAAAAPYASIPDAVTAPVTPAATPVVAAGVQGAASGYILGGLAVLAVIFASARPGKMKFGIKPARRKRR